MTDNMTFFVPPAGDGQAPAENEARAAAIDRAADAVLEENLEAFLELAK